MSVRTTVVALIVATVLLLTAAPIGANTIDPPPSDQSGTSARDCLLNPLGCGVDVIIDGAGAVGGAVIGGISEQIAGLAGGAFTTIVGFFGQTALTVLELMG